ncbi:MAG: DUF2306 domain-containing protein [Bacteroidota bacterium]
MATITSQRIFWVLFWLLIVGSSLYFYVTTAIDYAGGYTPENFKLGFFESKIWFIGHIAGASAALLLGPFQFWKSIRTKYMRYHRTAGKIFIIGSLIAAVCAFRINLMYDCKPCRVSLAILSIIWFACTFAAWWAIKNKNVKTHQQFMVRSYTAALAFVFIRLFPVLGYKNIFPFLDTTLDRRTTAEWLCWVVPFIIIETYMIGWPSLKKGPLKPNH